MESDLLNFGGRAKKNSAFQRLDHLNPCRLLLRQSSFEGGADKLQAFYSRSNKDVT